MTAKEEKTAAGKAVIVGKPVEEAPRTEEDEEMSQRPIQDKVIGFIGGLVTIMGALLPWVTGSASGGSEKTFSGWEVGTPGVIVLLFGLITMGLIFLGRRSSVLGAIIFVLAAMVVVGLSMIAMKAITNISVSRLEYGIFMSLAGSVVALIGAVSLYELTPKFEVNIKAFITFIVALVGTFLLLLYPFIFPGSGALGALYFIFGLLLLVPAFYMLEAEGWSWSSGTVVLAFVFLFAVPTLNYILITYSVVFAVILFLFRLTYGVGAWKLQHAKEEKERKIRNAKRTANTGGLHCPRCGGTKLYICDDGSTFCADCKEGFVNIRDAKAAPKSSVQV